MNNSRYVQRESRLGRSPNPANPIILEIMIQTLEELLG